MEMTTIRQWEEYLMSLSKALDCIVHDLLLAKLAAYGIDDDLILYIRSYLLDHKRCVCINNIYTK